jgi:hypothetical protein
MREKRALHYEYKPAEDREAAQLPRGGFLFGIVTILPPFPNARGSHNHGRPSARGVRIRAIRFAMPQSRGAA